MEFVYPSYYPEFSCLKSDCRHSCCIGWEIDIDPETVEAYRHAEGPLAEKFKTAIQEDEAPHFCLTDEERCPFLTDDGLCEIILAYGEEGLCDICYEHPRFYRCLPDREEVGLGMACEAAAALILGNQAPFSLCSEGIPSKPDPARRFRDTVLTQLTDRSLPLEARLHGIFEALGVPLPTFPLTDWSGRLLSLERMDHQWTEELMLLNDASASVDTDAFSSYLGERMTEYEQLLCYFVYRYVADATDKREASCYLRFAVLAYRVLFSMGAIHFMREGEFPFEQQVDLCRMFSAEIEYSEENRDAVLSLLSKEQ